MRVNNIHELVPNLDIEERDGTFHVTILGKSVISGTLLGCHGFISGIKEISELMINTGGTGCTMDEYVDWCEMNQAISVGQDTRIYCLTCKTTMWITDSISDLIKILEVLEKAEWSVNLDGFGYYCKTCSNK